VLSASTRRVLPGRPATGAIGSRGNIRPQCVCAILAATDTTGVHLSDFEGAQAADPLTDLAKTLYYDPRVDDARRSALLAGYRVAAGTPWRERVALYRLYFTFEF
jgi:hypothetical protein